MSDQVFREAKRKAVNKAAIRTIACAAAGDYAGYCIGLQMIHQIMAATPPRDKDESKGSTDQRQP